MSDPDPNDGVLFANLNPDDPEEGRMEMSSLCPNCHEQGMTRLMLTRIPYFREVILSSFICEECNHENRLVQPGGRVQDKGIRFEVTIATRKDMDRQVIRSDSATFFIPELQFDSPPRKQGEVTTVEGLLDGVIRGLNQEQPVRRAVDSVLADKIDSFLAQLEKLKDLGTPFTIVIDDPSGNSFVENPSAPQPDESAIITKYVRTRTQEEQLGLTEEGGGGEVGEPADSGGAASSENSQQAAPEPEDKLLKDEVLSFPTNCPSCNAPCQTNMKIIDIPFFKEVVIMATVCDKCGNRENEVKGGAGTADLASRITLKVTDPSDLNRDVLKSDTCAVRIPELELELTEGTLGGRFTTIEGLLVQIKDELKDNNPFFVGDSADMKSNMTTFIDKLDSLIIGKVGKFTFILDDPAGNSYLQNLYAPEPDPEMTTEKYTRTRDQDETLGLLDMKTENYR